MSFNTALSFGECEHDGDLDVYCVDLTKCGATIKSRSVMEDEEQGYVEIEVEDWNEFLVKFKETESYGFCG